VWTSVPLERSLVIRDLGQRKWEDEDTKVQRQERETCTENLAVMDGDNASGETVPPSDSRRGISPCVAGVYRSLRIWRMAPLNVVVDRRIATTVMETTR